MPSPPTQSAAALTAWLPPPIRVDSALLMSQATPIDKGESRTPHGVALRVHNPPPPSWCTAHSG
ncbi:MAG: hypothetical protein FJX22_02900 [Alphaproteobacteria bacterium]|nr:hypothetical protein [Alphaproteobacteria bacterium]